MAVAKDSLLSLGHFTALDRNTFTKREHDLKKSRVMHLQQRWQELRERELMAKQHNKQLLLQFDEAQDTLREMLVRTAAMKTLRMEYERYLEENSLRWQQQLKEKTQGAQRKRIEEGLKTCLKNSEERVIRSCTDQPLRSQGLGKKPVKVAAPQDFDSSQDGSSYLRLMQSSWLTQCPSQPALFPNRVPTQPQDLSHLPPSFLQPPISAHPQPLQLQQLSPTPHRHPLSQHGPSSWASHPPHYPWSCAATGGLSGSEALWGQLYMEEPPPDSRVSLVVGEEAETSRAPSSKRERGGGSRSSRLSEELDVKPVRLSSGHAESSESSRESSQDSREKRKRRRRRRAESNSSDRETHSSQESSQASHAAVSVSAATAKSSGSDVSEKSSSRRMRRSEGLAVASSKTLRTERSKEDNSGSHNAENRSSVEESESQMEESISGKAGAQSPVDKSETSAEESGSQREEPPGNISVRPEKEATGETEKQESSTSEQSSVEDNDEEDEEEDHENKLGDGDEDDDAEEKENSHGDEEQEEEGDGEVSARKNKTEAEEEETGAEDEEESEDQEDDEQSGGENGKKESASSQGEDEDESEGSGDKTEGEGFDEEARGDEEEQRSNKAEEERDSDDSIISPQENRCKKMHIIPEEAAEDDEGKEESKMSSDDDDEDDDDDDEGSNEHSEDDIELLLAPQEQTQKKAEEELKADEKTKVICDVVERFHVEQDRSTKSDHFSDSDEFDHFYD